MSLFKKFAFVILFFALAAMALPRAGATEAAPLRAVAWNLEWFPGRKPGATAKESRAHMAVAQKTLKELNPDLLLCEEIGDWDAFHELVSVVPGMQVHTVSAFRQGESGPVTRQQVAIASKLPANSTWSEPWKATGALPPRGFAFAALTLPDGKLVFVYAVHLKSNRTTATEGATANAAKREESARQLLAHVADMEKIYRDFPIQGVVIGGDFNTNEDRPEWKNEQTLSLLEKAGLWNCWSPVAAAQRLSWRGTKRFVPTTFDFFLLKGFGNPAARIGEAPEETSDHHPVLVDLTPSPAAAHAAIPSPEDAHPH